MNCAQKLTHQNEGNERIIVKEFQLIKAKQRERERERERENGLWRSVEPVRRKSNTRPVKVTPV